MLQSAKSEMERQSSLREEAQDKLKETEASLKSVQAKSKQLINALQVQLEEQTKAKVEIISWLHPYDKYNLIMDIIWTGQTSRRCKQAED